ncbi:hypothetical protein ElyMa_004429000 [Elysia marginata]|uniref:Uncharacterized protein n=1 Tax=Elysia marginata TaxID=1093978 RepID=A0AAV4HCK9_9GAST|nr:hypothetical protein ElyMa_004429000 [Elysia marginata]
MSPGSSSQSRWGRDRDLQQRECPRFNPKCRRVKSGPRAVKGLRTRAEPTNQHRSTVLPGSPACLQGGHLTLGLPLSANSATRDSKTFVSSLGAGDTS